MADPDPPAKELPKHKKSTVRGKNGSVTFTPEDIRPRKKSKSKKRDVDEL